MRVEKGLMVALGYGKYFRSDRIVGLEPIEDGRGSGQRTRVYLEQHAEPIVASRSEGTILRDLVNTPKEVTQAQEQQQLLCDILDTLSEINPMLRSIIREQGQWDIDRLEARLSLTSPTPATSSTSASRPAWVWITRCGHNSPWARPLVPTSHSTMPSTASTSTSSRTA